MYHYVFVYIVVLFVIFRFGGIPRRAAKLEAKIKAKKEANQQESKKEQ